MNAIEQHASANGPPTACDGRSETLLADIGSQLLSAPLEALDSAITTAQTRLIAFLQVERSTVRLIDPVDSSMVVTHSVAAAGVQPVPLGVSKSELPWFHRCIERDRAPIVFAQTSELPPEAAFDLKYAEAYGQKSGAVFPIQAGSQLLGALSFATARVERSWPERTVARLRLISQIFAGAFLRLDYERKLQASLVQIQTFGERLQAENQYLQERTFTGDG